MLAPPLLALAATVPPKLLLPIPAATLRPMPPSGFASVPVAAPLAVRVVEEEKKEEEAVESAQNNFAAYHPDQSNDVLPAVAVVLILLAAGGGITGLRRARDARGGGAGTNGGETQPRYRNLH